MASEIDGITNALGSMKASGMSFDGNYDLSGMLGHFLDLSKNTTVIMPEDKSKTYMILLIVLVGVYFMFKKTS